MKSVCLVNGSLRGEKSSSHRFLADIQARIDPAKFDVQRIAVKAKTREPYSRDVLAVMAGAEAILIAFPLFTYTLPGGLTRLLEDFSTYAKDGQYNKNAKVFAVVNCGFPEPGICREAIRVVKNFSAKLGLSYRFTIAVASGPVTVLTSRIPFLNPGLKRAYARIVNELQGADSGEAEDVYLKPILPKGLIIRIKDHYEKKTPTLRPIRQGGE